MSDLTRNSFLVTTSGWVLGNVVLPPMSEAQLAAKKKTFSVPSKDPNSFVSWLEHDSVGVCRTMVFMAIGDADKAMIRRLTEALRVRDFRLERLREAPHQEGDWVVRLAVQGQAKFITTSDEHILFAPQGSADVFSDDPNKAANFTYAKALMVSARLMREMQARPDMIVYMEPVRREAAIANPGDVGVIFVDYLPSIDPNAPPPVAPGERPAGRAATVYLVARRETDEMRL